MRRALLLSAVLPVSALVVAGCGGSGGLYGSKKTATTPPARHSAVVGLRTTSLGRVLVDGSGRTLYLFEKDKGPRSTCAGACASAWPPVTTSTPPTAGAGISAAKLGIAPRPGGEQVVYAGHPLYTYAGDGGPGQTNGEGLDQFGAEWYVLGANGSKIEKGS
jgi:predicted lipoprotein with Yx(FWY)xxD motif